MDRGTCQPGLQAGLAADADRWDRQESGMTARGVVAAAGHEQAKAGDLIGWWNGRPIYLPGGGAPDEGEGGGDQGGESGSGGDSGEGESGGSIFDGNSEDGDDGGEGSGDGDGGGSVTINREELARLVAQEANRVADRRINQALRRREGRERDERGDRDRGGRDGDRDRVGRDEAPAGPTPADVREARLVYREYVGDAIRFVGAEERTFAADLAQALLPGLLQQGVDVEDAGRQVAEQVADRVRETRKFYERQAISALKRQGVLPKDYKPGQPKKGPSGGQTPQSGWQHGEAKAKEMFADRMPQPQQQ